MKTEKGDSGFEKHVDRLMELANSLYQELKRRPNFMMVLDNVIKTPELINISYY